MQPPQPSVQLTPLSPQSSVQLCPQPFPRSPLQPQGSQRPQPQAWAQPAATTRVEIPFQTPKIAYIADSIGCNVNFDMLEKATGAVIKKTKAYCSKFGGKIPAKNFTEVVPKVLSVEKYDYLIVQASSTDLTNLRDLPESTANEYYKQQAVLSSYQMVAAIDSALTSHPYLKGVVLMERPPRYDDLRDLNRLANGLLHEAVAKSRNVGKIFIGQHNLECEGGLQASRYGTPSSHQYDGIHLRGTSGRMAFTRSVASIFQQAGILAFPLQVTVPRLTPRNNTQTKENFHLGGKRRGFKNPARRQNSFQSAGRSQGVFQQAQQQHQGRPLVPLMEVNIPTQNRFQGFW